MASEKLRSELSEDARAVAAAWFGAMPVPGNSTLRFAMVEHRPSPRAQAGLDELLAAKIISREDEPSGAVVYRPLVCCREYLAWAFMRGPSEGDFRLVDRIAPGKKPLKRAGTIELSGRQALAQGRDQGEGSDAT